MGSKYRQEDSPNLSEEESDQAMEIQKSGILRSSYECVFCKRGFTTAQALGGHMNIHRKHKAKTRPPCKDNNLEQTSYGSKVPTIFPVSTTSCTRDNNQNPSPEYQLGLSLSLRFGTSKFSTEEVQNKRRVCLIQEDLDLELRLGHNP